MYDLATYRFGEILKRARKAKNMTIEELGDKIGKTASTVYKYERDEVETNLYTVIEICNVLNIDINEFVDKESIEVEKSVSQNPFGTDKLYLYYIGFEDIILFELEIVEENGYQKVYFRNRSDNKILYVGIIEESNYDIAFITLKNYYVTNKKFEKVQIVVNLKYAADNRYMAMLTGIQESTNLPIVKKCILCPELITTKNEINETYKRLLFTETEKEKLNEKNSLVIHFDNKIKYEMLGINEKDKR